MLIPWPTLYRLINDEEHVATIANLRLPPILAFRPILEADKTLSDPEFSIVLTGWRTEQGFRVQDRVEVSGGWATWRAIFFLLPEPCWLLLTQAAIFNHRTDEERNQTSQFRAWGQLRALALQAKAVLDPYLAKTQVHTPATLDLELRKTTCGGTTVVEVVPGFPRSPEGFLPTFDRLDRVQDLYTIPSGEGVARIYIDQKTKTVLQEIKSLKHRRLAGENGEAFLRNPYALLGEDAQTVISPEHRFSRYQIANNITSARRGVPFAGD